MIGVSEYLSNSRLVLQTGRVPCTQINLGGYPVYRDFGDSLFLK